MSGSAPVTLQLCTTNLYVDNSLNGAHNCKTERQKYLEEEGIKTAREMIKTKLEMWDIGNNLGKERVCWCGELESTEHILECEKVKEIMEKNGEKGWLVSEKSEDLLKATEYIKSFKGRRDEKN